MAHYNVGHDERVINAHLKLALRAGVKNHTLKQAKGTGASGSFRVGEKKEAIKKPKAKKPKKAKAVKKPKAAGAKKVKKPKKAAAPKVKKAAVKKPKVAKKPAAAKAKKPKAAKPKKPKAVAKAKKSAKKWTLLTIRGLTDLLYIVLPWTESHWL